MLHLSPNASFNGFRYVATQQPNNKVTFMVMLLSQSNSGSTGNTGKLVQIFPFIHRYALKELNLLGEDMQYVPLEEIGIMRNLRSVGLSKVRNYGSVTPSQASRRANQCS